MVRQAPVICVMAPPIHLGAWSMGLMLWLPFAQFSSHQFVKFLIILLCRSNWQLSIPVHTTHSERVKCTHIRLQYKRAIKLLKLVSYCVVLFSVICVMAPPIHLGVWSMAIWAAF